MDRLFKPTWLMESIYDLKPEELKERGLKGLIIDLDNTLLAWDELEASPRLISWVSIMNQAGVKVYLLSNNKPDRVSRGAAPLELSFAASALKPLKKQFIKALMDMNLAKDQVAVVGDQVMTDVLGANRVGLQSILVKPIVESDNIYTKFNRQIEKGVLKTLGISKQDNWGHGLND